jgi:hypothetical protein
MNLKSKLTLLSLVLLAACFPKEEGIEPKPRLNKSVEISAGESKLEVSFYSIETDSLLATASPVDWDIYYDENGLKLNGFRSMSAAIFTTDWANQTDTLGLDFKYLTVGFEKSMWELKPDTTYVLDMGIDLNYQPLGFYKFKFTKTGGDYTLYFSKLDEGSWNLKSLNSNEAYYSFLNSSSMDLPLEEDYDLAFGKYTDYVIFPDEEADYLVFGAITGNASAYELEENFDDVDDSVIDTITFNHQIKTGIGWNWKWYDLNAGAYAVRENRTFIIKTAQGLYYKLRFTSFYNTKGISGHPTFEYKLL